MHLISLQNVCFFFGTPECIRASFPAACCCLVAERRKKIKKKVEVMNTSEQVLLNIFILCLLSFAVMDYAPPASSVPATLFVAAGNIMEGLASGNGRAVKCKSVCERHTVFVLLEQMDVGSQPKENFSHRQEEQIKPDILFFLPFRRSYLIPILTLVFLMSPLACL